MVMMALVTSTNLKSLFDNKNKYELTLNFNKHNIIVYNPEIDVSSNKSLLKTYLNNIVTGQTDKLSYHELNNLFTNIQLYNITDFIDVVLEIINENLTLMRELISDNIITDLSLDRRSTNFQLNNYTNVWKVYSEYMSRLKKIFKLYNTYFEKEKVIDSNNFINDIFSIIQITEFYDYVYNSEFNNNKLHDLINNNLETMDKKHIDDIINYIDSLKNFQSINKFSDRCNNPTDKCNNPLDKCNNPTDKCNNPLNDIIKNILNQHIIINNMCYAIDGLLRTSFNTNSNNVNLQSFETMQVDSIESISLKKIYKILSLMTMYSDKQMIILYYTKFMKPRIMQPNYNLLELEIEFIKRLTSLIGLNNAQKLIDMVHNINNSQNFSKFMNNIPVTIKSEPYVEYKDRLANNNVYPLLLDNNLWHLSTADLTYELPIELKYYINELCPKVYNVYQNKSKKSINDLNTELKFVSNMGMVELNYCYQINGKNHNINLICNIYQATVLLFMNNINQITINEFCSITNMPNKLAEITFESLFNSNILVCIDELYMINKNVNFDKYDKEFNAIEEFNKLLEPMILCGITIDNDKQNKIEVEKSESEEEKNSSPKSKIAKIVKKNKIALEGSESEEEEPEPEVESVSESVIKKNKIIIEKFNSIKVEPVQVLKTKIAQKNIYISKAPVKKSNLSLLKKSSINIIKPTKTMPEKPIPIYDDEEDEEVKSPKKTVTKPVIIYDDEEDDY